MNKINFNSGWLFKKADGNEWQNIVLPHDAMLYEKRTADAPSGSAGGYYQGGKYIYKKIFKPEVSLGKKLILGFEGVTANVRLK